MPAPHHVVFHRPGPAWRSGVPPFQQEGVASHVAHYRQWLESGKLLLGGPFLDAGGGGMMIATAAVDGAALAEFAAEDPAVASGLLVAEVRPWLVGMSSLP